VIHGTLKLYPSRYWTSATHQGNRAYAWEVDFVSGYVAVHIKDDVVNYVRAVRGGS
jgi:hypothetical protein